MPVNIGAMFFHFFFFFLFLGFLNFRLQRLSSYIRFMLNLGRGLIFIYVFGKDYDLSIKKLLFPSMREYNKSVSAIKVHWCKLIRTELILIYMVYSSFFYSKAFKK